VDVNDVVLVEVIINTFCCDWIVKITYIQWSVIILHC